MKILQLTNKVPYPPRDGGAIASLTLARELALAGHEVVVLAMNTSKHFIDPADQSVRPPEPIRWELIPVDTRIRWQHALRNLLFSRLPYNAERFRSAAYRERLISLLKTENFDFIILDQLYTGLYLDDIRAHTVRPVILRAHNIEHEIWSRSARSSKGLSRLYLTLLAGRIRRFERSIINRYDALVPISPRDGEQFRAMGNLRPCHVLPTGMNPATGPQPAHPETRPTVAHLGALDWLPNQDGIKWFVRLVWPEIRRRIPNIEFHLAGRNAPEGFEKQITAPGVIFHGEVESAQEFIRNHTIFIVPIFSGSGMRIKLLDYLAAGKATVTTTIGAEGIPVEDGMETFISNQPGEFAGRVVHLVENPALRSEMGSRAVEFIRKNFDNHQLIKQFTEFLITLDNRG